VKILIYKLWGVFVIMCLLYVHSGRFTSTIAIMVNSHSRTSTVLVLSYWYAARTLLQYQLLAEFKTNEKNRDMALCQSASSARVEESDHEGISSPPPAKGKTPFILVIIVEVFVQVLPGLTLVTT